MSQRGKRLVEKAQAQYADLNYYCLNTSNGNEIEVDTRHILPDKEQVSDLPMTHMYGSSGSEYVSCKGVPKGVEMEPKSINEEDRDLISSNINIENKMEVDTQQMSDDDWVLHSPASCLFESSGSEYVPGEEESSDDGDSVKLASIGVSSRENTEQGVGNLEAEENITNVSLEEASSTNNLQTLSVEATNTTEKINIFNASITTKGTKIIKTFPIKIKTSKLRVRNPDTWKRRKALLARE
uniref:Uncharacterized protein LOC114346014 n=1 Tax=Diabrotica virgifera virgifera TaxID=50390 RepID=A0A6P7H4L8_DIAVI